MNEREGHFHPGCCSFGRLDYGHPREGLSPHGDHGFHARMVLVAMCGPMAEARRSGRGDRRVLNWRRFYGSDREGASQSAWDLAFQAGCECQTHADGGGISVVSHRGRVEEYLDRVTPAAAGVVDLVWYAIGAVAVRLLDQGELNQVDLDQVVSRVGGKNSKNARQQIQRRLRQVLTPGGDPAVFENRTSG